MATEELDEFEVLWPEAGAGHLPHERAASAEPVTCAVPAQPSDAPAARSWPVDVPGRPLLALERARAEREGGDHDDDDDNGYAIVPPHLLLTAGCRREEVAETAAWTLRASAGPPWRRARDLRHLRASVLRMTGFIEG